MKQGKIHIGTSGWVYKHWRGTFYPEDLKAADCKKWQQKGKDIYVYFDNDQEGYAAFNALRLMELTQKK